MGVGMPETLLLHEFGSHLWSIFGKPAYHVGSSLGPKGTVYRDVDVRMILDDEEYASEGYGEPSQAHQNLKWVSMCLALSQFGRHLTGLPIDFQIQQRTDANQQFPGSRSAIGMVPLRLVQSPVSAALQEYSREMEEAIPQIVNDVKHRAALAEDARSRVMKTE